MTGAPAAHRAGDLVHTPLGKGVVREVRNNGRLLVEVQGRAVELRLRDVRPLEPPRRGRRSAVRQASAAATETSADEATAEAVEIDLHGLTTEQAVERVDQALNDALLAGAAELRIIHGRSGGRLRSAVHARLRELAPVRGFRLDERNPGVTVVTF